MLALVLSPSVRTPSATDISHTRQSFDPSPPQAFRLARAMSAIASNTFQLPIDEAYLFPLNQATQKPLSHPLRYCTIDKQEQHYLLNRHLPNSGGLNGQLLNQSSSHNTHTALEVLVLAPTHGLSLTMVISPSRSFLNRSVMNPRWSDL